MPQIHLECTNNVLEKDVNGLLLEIHNILSKSLPTELHSCKSRASIVHDYVIGDGDKNNAFVHLSIGVLKGRPPELLNSIGTTLLKVLADAFSSSLSKLNLQITIAVSELPDVYKKYVASAG